MKLLAVASLPGHGRQLGYPVDRPVGQLSTLGHKFGDVFWGLGCQGIIRQGLELCHQFPQFDACEPPFEWLGDLFIV